MRLKTEVLDLAVLAVLVERGGCVRRLVGVGVDCEVLEVGGVGVEVVQLVEVVLTTLPVHRSELAEVATWPKLAILVVVVERARRTQLFVGVAVDCELLELSIIHAETTQLSDRLCSTLPAHRSDSTYNHRRPKQPFSLNNPEQLPPAQPIGGVAMDCELPHIHSVVADVAQLSDRC